jgi:formylglycine-generating enzyme required for sulfatase activity
MNPDTFVNHLDRIDPRLPTAIGALVAACTVVAVVLKAMKTVREHGKYNLLRDAVLVLAVCTCAGVITLMAWTYLGGALPRTPASPPEAPGAQLASLGGPVVATGGDDTAPPPAPPDVADLPATLKVSGDVELVLVRPGQYAVGSPETEPGRLRDERKRRTAVVERPFYVGRTEVTQGQWKGLSGRPNPSYFAPGGEGADKVAGLDADLLPVEQVTLDEAAAFCAKLSAGPAGTWRGWRFVLPTEAQWEVACRAGSEAPFHCGAVLGAGDANFDSRTPYGGADKAAPRDRTTPAGALAANDWGLRDMHGNVAEWCRADGPAPKGQEGLGVVCGGSWSSPGFMCRAAARDGRDPRQRYSDIGFRVAFVFEP